MEHKVIVIGGSNIDIISKPFNKLIENDSNPGETRISFGGVARNIAENLLRLNVNTTFITAIGNDNLGTKMKNELLNLNCNLIMPTNCNNCLTSTYTAILDNNGDMKLAVCDSSIANYIDVDYLKSISNVFDDKDIIVIDTNIDKEAFDYLLNQYNDKKIIVDAISTSKVTKVIDNLDKIYLLKVNKYEYNVIKKAKKLPKYILISRGSEDIILLDTNNNKSTYYPVIKKDIIINATGAGDALLAGVVSNIDNLDSAIKLGIKCSSITLDCLNAVNKDISKLIER